MAQLTAGLYYTRGWRVVNLLTSSVNGAGQTVWAANLPAPTGGYGNLTLDSPVTYVESGLPLPGSGVPPVGPLATLSFAATDVVDPVPPGSGFSSDIMAQVGTVQSLQGLAA
jgi:hypothetical protein